MANRATRVAYKPTPFYYDGGVDGEGYHLVVMSDGTPLPGWYYFNSAADERTKSDPDGPFASEADALASIKAAG